LLILLTVQWTCFSFLYFCYLNFIAVLWIRLLRCRFNFLILFPFVWFESTFRCIWGVIFTFLKKPYIILTFRSFMTFWWRRFFNFFNLLIGFFRFFPYLYA
jgi:hypothetical protein